MTQRHLSECVTSFWKLGNTGTKFEETADTSTYSKRAVQKIQHLVQISQTEYETVLIWKEDSTLDNNCSVARAKLDSL